MISSITGLHFQASFFFLSVKGYFWGYSEWTVRQLRSLEQNWCTPVVACIVQLNVLIKIWKAVVGRAVGRDIETGEIHGKGGPLISDASVLQIVNRRKVQVGDDDYARRGHHGVSRGLLYTIGTG